MDAIQEALQMAGSQTELARVAGVSQTAVHKWATGKTKPSFEAARRIERAMGIPKERIAPHIYKTKETA